MIQENTNDIKGYFIGKLRIEDFVMDRSGQKTIELIGASFFADQPVISVSYTHLRAHETV